MAQLRQLHLQFAFETAGALGENIQNQSGAIHHPALQEGFQIALLAGAQRMIENRQFRPVLLDRRANFLGLAAADEQARVRCRSASSNERHTLSARRGRQFPELGGIRGIFGSIQREMHQNGALTAARTLEQTASPRLRPSGLLSARAPLSSIARFSRTLRTGTTVEMACL